MSQHHGTPSVVPVGPADDSHHQTYAVHFIRKPVINFNRLRKRPDFSMASSFIRVFLRLSAPLVSQRNDFPRLCFRAVFALKGKLEGTFWDPKRTWCDHLLQGLRSAHHGWSKGSWLPHCTCSHCMTLWSLLVDLCHWDVRLSRMGERESPPHKAVVPWLETNIGQALWPAFAQAAGSLR
jgi:hypothetical protein